MGYPLAQLLPWNGASRANEGERDCGEVPKDIPGHRVHGYW
jgi:hypothetical protein